jgi:phosphatidylglycerophosphate synthase
MFLAINWFGDSLDGTLARVRQQPRPRYGYYVDHVVDAIGAMCLFGGMAASGFMSAPVAAVLLIAYFLLCLEVYLATVSLGEFRMSFFGVGPTELRIVLALGNIALLVHPTAVVAGHTFKLFDVGGVIGAAGLLATFLFSAARNTRTLYREEPLPPRRP